ncbi:MAG: COX15/CtaA family protein [Actinomycetia bacterium]|nr:COX15/CtaA family protein [Actinomycetes bacterium]
MAAPSFDAPPAAEPSVESAAEPAGPFQPGSRSVGAIGRRILLANVVAEIGIVVTGGLVRLTGSGLGCPTWPECTDESLIPVPTQSEGFHKFIEFGNRLLTFAVLVAAVAALIVVLRPWLAKRFPGTKRLGEPGTVRRPLGWLAVGVNLGIVAQAALGGVTVLLDLNPAVVAAHFLLSMAMIAAAYLLYRRAADPGDQPVTIDVRAELRWVAYALVVFCFAVLVLGTVVTGSGPHSGDADEIARFGFDIRMVSWLHADLVMLFLGLALTFTLGARLSGAPVHATRAGLALLAVCLAQGALGYTQYFTGVPVPLVSLHMLGACLVWVATLEVLVSTRTRGVNTAEDAYERSVVVS